MRLCEERGLGPADVTPALLDEAAMRYHEKPAGLDQKAIDDALDPGALHRLAHDCAAVPRKRNRCARRSFSKTSTAADEKIVADIDARLAEAARKLEAAVDAVIAMDG